MAALLVKRLTGVPPQLIALVQVSLGLLLLLSFADFAARPSTLTPWLWLLGLGALHTALMYILLYSAIQVLPTARVAVLSFVYPAVALGVDYAFYGQRLGAAQWAGIALIALGNLGVNLGWALPSGLRRDASTRGTRNPASPAGEDDSLDSLVAGQAVACDRDEAGFRD